MDQEYNVVYFVPLCYKSFILIIVLSRNPCFLLGFPTNGSSFNGVSFSTFQNAYLCEFERVPKHTNQADYLEPWAISSQPCL